MTTFNEFLQEKCEQQESDIMSKDNFEAVSDRWFENLDVQELIDFGEEYGRLVAYETASDIGDKITTIVLQLHDNK